MVAPRTTKEEKTSAVALRVMNPASDENAKPNDSSQPQQTVPNPKPEANAKKRRTKAKAKAKAKARAKAKANVAEPVIDLAKGSRGIDTLLRNAYRSQLDMLALAATKANIMISLNGLLMSMLVISSTQLVSIDGVFVIPVAVFLVTCAAAITFAVFAARPNISQSKYGYNDFMRDDARLMVFEEFSDLRESEYLDAMTELLKDPARTYRSMLSHIHDLGVTADKKYQHLYYSYTVFMAGTIATVLSLLVLVALRWYGIITPDVGM